MRNLISVVLLALAFIIYQGLASGRTKEVQISADEQYNARLLHSAMLAGDWLVNNQNKKTLWESDYFNGDYGRWLYEYKITDGFWRGSVCWTTATGIMDLIMLHKRTSLPRYKDAIDRAAVYLKSLQILDSRNPRNFGAVREMSQLDNYIFPRDGMTTVGGYLALYRFTKDSEYLERAKLYADWYLKYAINPETGWTYANFPFDSTDFNKHIGYYQAGGGLFLYHLYKITGNRKYFEKGTKHLADKFLEYFTNEDGSWKLEYNNDDFGAITLLCAYRELNDKKYWNAVQKRLEQLMSAQRDDGALIPGNTGGCYVAALTALNMMALADEKGIEIDKTRINKFIRRCTDFALTLQETDPAAGTKAYGAFYGQINLNDFRKEWLHARATTYSVLFNLRREGKVSVPFYSVHGWDD
ncbi:MAG: hypothetical protein ACYS1A_03460 [Planctomycetota bacterium]|jgi:hypothetical protein